MACEWTQLLSTSTLTTAYRPLLLLLLLLPLVLPFPLSLPLHLPSLLPPPLYSLPPVMYLLPPLLPPLLSPSPPALLLRFLLLLPWLGTRFQPLFFILSSQAGSFSLVDYYLAIASLLEGETPAKLPNTDRPHKSWLYSFGGNGPPLSLRTSV